MSFKTPAVDGSFGANPSSPDEEKIYSHSKYLRKYAMLVSYNGTRFCGWQKQSGSAAEGAESIQLVLERALSKVTDEKVSVVGSGRTDAGVHAVGQVVHFVLRCEREWDVRNLQLGVNSLLRSDVRENIQVLKAMRVPIEFHAQRSAEKKQYSYYFQQGPCAIPHAAPQSFWIRKTLDQEAMREALGYLIGEHDFKPFQAAGSSVSTTVRSILEGDVTWQPFGLPTGLTPVSNQEIGFVRVRIVGTGFLRHMVRGIAGTLLQVGEGRRSPDCMKEILASGDRNLVGATAPARGLWLEQVWYDGLVW